MLHLWLHIILIFPFLLILHLNNLFVSSSLYLFLCSLLLSFLLLSQLLNVNLSKFSQLFNLFNLGFTIFLVFHLYRIFLLMFFNPLECYFLLSPFLDHIWFLYLNFSLIFIFIGLVSIILNEKRIIIIFP